MKQKTDANSSKRLRQIRQRVFNISKRGFKDKATRPRIFQPGFLYFAKLNPVARGEVVIGPSFNHPIVAPYDKVEALALLDSDGQYYARLLLCHTDEDGRLILLKDAEHNYLFVYACAQDMSAGRFTKITGKTALGLAPNTEPVKGMKGIDHWNIMPGIIDALSTANLQAGDQTECGKRTAIRLEAAKNSTEPADIEAATRILEAKVKWIASQTETTAA